MNSFWIDISDIPADGREFSFSDPAMWRGPAKEYNVDVDFSEDIGATFTVMLVERGCTVFGSFHAEVTAPCGRCTEPARLSLSRDFQINEDLDADEEAEEKLLREEDGKIELDAGTILWEQFVLALPGKVLCDDECKGLCPQCGADLNKESCSCVSEEGDPRMAALRGLKVSDKKKK